MNTTKQLEELVGRKNGRLDDLRTAVLPVAALLALCKRPASSAYKIYVRHQRTNVGSCDWLMVENLASDTECWTPELRINETGGFVHGDFDAPYPDGPTPRQLRAFAAWLSCPDTLAAYVAEEQAAEQSDLSAIDKLTAMAAAAAD